ncbi:MAG: hypothetical protein WA061_05015 [Microgenomates group bacterium]
MTSEIAATVLIILAIIVVGVSLRGTINFHNTLKVVQITIKKANDLFFSMPLWLRIVFAIFLLLLYAIYNSGSPSSQEVYIPDGGPTL